MIIEEIAEVRRTPVGDTYVSEELLKWGDFGGEPSGAWIFPEDFVLSGWAVCRRSVLRNCI